MLAVKHFLNFMGTSSLFNPFFIGEKTNVCHSTLVFCILYLFLFLNHKWLAIQMGIRDKILDCQSCLEFNIFYLHNYVFLEFNIFIYIMKLMT